MPQPHFRLSRIGRASRRRTCRPSPAAPAAWPWALAGAALMTRKTKAQRRRRSCPQGRRTAPATKCAGAFATRTTTAPTSHSSPQPRSPPAGYTGPRRQPPSQQYTRTLRAMSVTGSPRSSTYFGTTCCRRKACARAWGSCPSAVAGTLSPTQRPGHWRARSTQSATTRKGRTVPCRWAQGILSWSCTAPRTATSYSVRPFTRGTRSRQT
mmetsp:Transcript_42984/g.122559  ORF Transcript_42984/g.122559 Transcript_42984/m.122559 type:complete len:210 (-) Transcript_42984:54-683(-)